MLRAAHAIGEENLVKALKDGQLVAPSIAVQPASVPLDFGGKSRVVVVFRPDALNFRADNVRSGDWYSPTMPSVTDIIKDGKQRDALVQATTEAWNKVPKSIRAAADSSVFPSRPSRNLDASRTTFSMAPTRGFSTATAPTLERVMGAIYLAEKGRKRVKDSYAFREILRSDRAGYEAWRDSFIVKHAEVTPSLFVGYTNTGKRRYTDATPDAMLKAMKKAAREKESGSMVRTFNELVAKQRTALNVSAAKRRVAEGAVAPVTEERRGEWKAMSSRFSTVLNGSMPADIDTARAFRYGGNVMDAFVQHGIGTPAALRELRSLDINLTPETVQDMRRLVDEAAAMPVPYFEAKPMRLVATAGIARAVVPSDVKPATMEALRAAGIPIARLKEGATAEDRAAAQTAPGVLFSRRQAEDPMQASDAQVRQRTMFEALAAKRLQPVDRIFRLIFAPLGGLNEKGEWKPGVKLSKMAGRALKETNFSLDPEGKFRWLNPALEQARASWLNRYGVDEEFIRRERRTHFDQAQIERIGIAFIETMEREKLTNSDMAALQEILEGKTPLNNEKLEGLAAPIREAIDKLGAELVEHGSLDRATYLENLGTYLHRSYVKYESEATPLQKWSRRRISGKRKGLIGDELRARGQLHGVPNKARLLSEVPQDQREGALKKKRWVILERVRADGKIAQRVYLPADMEVPAKFKQPGWSERQGPWGLMFGKGGKFTLRTRLLEGRARDDG